MKFPIDDMYAGRLKRPTWPPRPWCPPLPVQPPQPGLSPLLLELDSLVWEARVIVASLSSPPLLPVEGEAVSVFRVIVF